MGDRILVAYAGRCGSTAEVAEAIGRTIADGKTAVDVQRVQDVTDLTRYRAVVLGSAVRVGKWLPEAMEFIKAHQSLLNRMPVAYFQVCNDYDGEQQ